MCLQGSRLTPLKPFFVVHSALQIAGAIPDQGCGDEVV